MALHVLDEANRCLGCKKPLCQQGCPIHTNIPEVIRLLKANQMDEAGRMLFENNPLTTVCALVCNHENQCEGHCVRNRMPSHDPVHFSIIEDYISTTYANKMTAGPAPKNGMKAAVVGSGPAGLTIAVLLARWGYDVTIFDARDKIGGVMRYGIPNYRLPDSVLDDFQYRHLELKGIKVRPNTTIGKTITIDDLFRDGYKSVFIGAGLWKANAMHIKGETLGNVAFGIDYLANSKAFRLGDDIAVIGEGALTAVYFTKSTLLEGKIQDLLGVFNMAGHMDNFVNGILDISGVVYYLSVIAICTFLAMQSLQKKRWN